MRHGKLCAQRDHPLYPPSPPPPAFACNLISRFFFGRSTHAMTNETTKNLSTLFRR